MISFLPLGGANEIGASCFYVNIEGTGIILDCGTHPQKYGIESLPNFDALSSHPVDIALISHAHQDHIDGLPFLVQKHPYVHIFTTPQTRGVAELTLHNAVGIMQEQLKDQNILRPYTHEEIDLLIQSIQWKAYQEYFTIDGYRHQSAESIRASFYDAGHILGSAGILLEHDGRSIFYTGDISLDAQFVLPGAEFPQQHIDTLIIECTHGSTEDVLLPDRDEEKARFALEANRVLEKGGSILIPVFALGKMQEMLAMIGRLMQKGTLAKVDVFTGGLGKKLTHIYDKNRYAVPFNNPDEILEEYQQKDIYETEQLMDVMRTPSIVLASSGMVVEGTVSFKLAQLWMQHKHNAIFLVGYMDSRTPGFRIQESNSGDTIQLTDMMEPQIIRCSIERFRFSAHSRRERLIEIVNRISPNNVILVHGEPESIDWMGNEILSLLPTTKVHAAEIGKQIEII